MNKSKFCIRYELHKVHHKNYDEDDSEDTAQSTKEKSNVRNGNNSDHMDITGRTKTTTIKMPSLISDYTNYTAQMPGIDCAGEAR